ncbi:MAG: hypothetical protein IPI49_09435 [Myxococcales bacterium]|nr:hypothetical protein [Myxococcales bacterium]
MSLDASLSKAQTEVPECVAVGFVDMSTGMLLAVRTVDSHPQEVLDLVAAATADLFQGRSVTAIEKLFRKSRGQAEDGKHYFHEILVISDNLLHIFQRSKKTANHAAVFVTRASANIGMVLSKSRSMMRELETKA